MSTSAESELVTFQSGDLLASKAQTLVNTVNCVGIMGKGIALAFKRRYPDMYKDYVRRCDVGSVKLGRPYAYQADDHLIVNFPTKNHWRAVSRLEDIVGYNSDIQLGTGHPQGGNALSASPERGVVDPSGFRVHGIRNLHLCDASVFPTSVKVNPCWSDARLIPTQSGTNDLTCRARTSTCPCMPG